MPPGIGYGPGMNGAMGAAPMGSTAPAITRPDMGGMKIRGAIMADLGMKALTQAISLVGANSEQGQALLKGLAIITKAFPAPVSSDLTQQEVKLLGARANPAPMGNPADGASALLGRLNLGGSAPTAANAAA